MISTRQILIFFGGFVLLFILALALDVPISTAVHDVGYGDTLKEDHSWLIWLLRRPGHFGTTIVICILFLLVKPRQVEAAAVVFLSGLFSGFEWIIKWIVGRVRPFHDAASGPFTTHFFADGIRGLFHARLSLTFPSGDVTLAFAMAVSLSWYLPRWKPLFYTLAALVVLERIGEGAHFPSDTVAGAGLGVVAAFAARRIVREVAQRRNANLIS